MFRRYKAIDTSYFFPVKVVTTRPTRKIVRITKHGKTYRRIVISKPRTKTSYVTNPRKIRKYSKVTKPTKITITKTRTSSGSVIIRKTITRKSKTVVKGRRIPRRNTRPIVRVIRTTSKPTRKSTSGTRPRRMPSQRDLRKKYFKQLKKPTKLVTTIRTRRKTSRCLF